ncbi:hydantoinase/oxoprolinase N-terminal domain-containing protein [Streptomyces sp. NPDC051658]|uniref:hydantoinase/oxoprolinase N-terminal domain-containing protein n=1 Tax=Streptomyces sp. NPDC051658 TaxID=3365667 RepID=UPI0037B21573
MTYRVAMDIGGTFTVVVAYDETRGTFEAARTPTTPGVLAEGVFSSLGRAVDDPADISFFVHGTTQGLNALLERKGARVLLLASAGLRDVYQIARGNRDRMFDLHYRKPVPLVDRYATAEAGGRFDSHGTELAPLDEAAVRAAARRARDEGFGAVAVALLFSYVNPAHELRAGEILAEELGDDVMIVLSHQVAREWREYERTSSAVLEAYTGPGRAGRTGRAAPYRARRRHAVRGPGLHPDRAARRSRRARRRRLPRIGRRALRPAP